MDADKIQLARSVRATRPGGAGYYREKCENAVDPVMRFHFPGRRTRVRAWRSFCTAKKRNIRLAPQTHPREKDIGKAPPARVQRGREKKNGGKMQQNPAKEGKKTPKMTLFSSYLTLTASKLSSDSSPVSPPQSANHELAAESDLSLRLNCP